MEQKKKLISNEIFEDYLSCEYKAYLKLHDHVGCKTEYETLQRRLDNSFFSKAQIKFKEHFPKRDLLSVPFLKLSDLKKSKALIFETSIELDGLKTFFHVLRRCSGESKLGGFYYEPVQYCRYKKVARLHKLILTYNAVVIGRLQGRLPDRGLIIYGEKGSTCTVKLKSYLKSVDKIITDLKAQLATTNEIPLILSSHCNICEFTALCQNKAREDDNLSLLRSISKKEIRKHNQKGIFTVNQLSYTFRPRKTPKRAKNPAKPRYFALQAQSLRENTIYIHGDPQLPKAETMIFFDIEGVPYRDFYYLIGLIKVSKNSFTHNYYWADREQDQEAIFNKFVQNVGQMTNANIYHFGAYDIKALKRMKNRIGKNLHESLESLLERSTNVLSIVYHHVYFPTYSNSLKDIGRVLECQWTDINSSGIQSIIWRETWQKTKDSVLKAKLIQYNKEDCLALKTICDFISSAKIYGEKNIFESGQSLKIAHTNDLKRNLRKRFVFRKPDFVFKDFEHVNKCAYFDYQRERVYVRTNKEFKSINKRKRQKKRWITYNYKPNKITKIQYDECHFCGSKDIEKGDEIIRFLIDIKFLKGGAKKWIVQYQTWRYKCLKCKKGYVSPNIPAYTERYGHGLISLCVYNHFARKQSMLQVGYFIGDVFDLKIEPTKLHRFKSSIAKFYKSTYDDIIDNILKGSIMHIDETNVNLRKKKGYVWVLTSMDKVYYFYKESREGAFLKDMLEPFSGVLISDFYSAYDSIDCPQQKCLIHLIRDINEDLKRNPFDDEFKIISETFSILLRETIKTVDRFGLKKRFLHKHKKIAAKYFRNLDSERFSSEIAQKYQKRFIKNRGKLFTFLDYDGVPWNNNNAESAVTFFAKHRRFADGRFTERSLNDFLIILSVIQTCEFNNINVLKFLLSKEKKIKNH